MLISENALMNHSCADCTVFPRVIDAPCIFLDPNLLRLANESDLHYAYPSFVCERLKNRPFIVRKTELFQINQRFKQDRLLLDVVLVLVRLVNENDF